MMRLRWMVAAVFVGVFAFYVRMTWRWGVTGDTAAMHYVAFLISRGRVPYAQITDMNMPGTYLCERLAMAVFGWGDVGWRCYEFFLMLALAATGVVIAGCKRWMGGVLAGAFFIVLHAADGPYVSAERDELITVLMAVAVAALLVAVRRRRPTLVLVYGLAIGLSLSIKPTGLFLDAAVLVLAAVVLHRRGERVLEYLVWGVAGQAVVGLAVVLWLAHFHALGPFVFVLRKVLPAYAGTNHLGLFPLLEGLLPKGLVLPLVAAILAAALRRESVEWEQWAVLVCAASGAASYLVQGKGYVHHRYEFLFFLVLWMGVEFAAAMGRVEVGSRACGVAGVLLVLLALPHFVRVVLRDSRGVHRVDRDGVLDIRLAQLIDGDLAQVGGDKLQGKVVCLDMLNGCLAALYRMRLVENTSSTGDMLLFAPVETPLARHYRDEFFALQRKDPAEVVVLGDEWFMRSTGDYRKVDTWPAYKQYLERNYTEVVERRGSKLPGAAGYKLLLRDGSPALAAAEARPLGSKPPGGLDAP
jgi:hypothetical protein